MEKLLYDPRILIQPYDPLVNQLAFSLGSPYKIFEFVRDYVKYKPDPNELWRTPAETLKLGYGDCDDQAILLCSMLLVVNEPSYVRVIAFRDGGGHAFVVWRENINWDPTIKKQKANQTVEYFNYDLILDFNNSLLKIYNLDLWRKIATW